ncbi:MAG: 30S ribosomal protein S17 [Candidatus Daviesbacteria bacterium]|nr:30S ribosomal protein S17 [Candidatus Daviesbacteria bacterium]
MTGRVVSVKMKNTVAVLVTGRATHPLYKKTYVRSKKYLADSNSLEVKLGDIVEMIKVRPISKNKHWKITKVVGRSLKEIAAEQLQEKGAEIISEVMPEPVKEVKKENNTEVQVEPKKRSRTASKK